MKDYKVAYLAWLGINYGSTLQAFALYKTIQKLGYPCEVIGAEGFINGEKPQPELKEKDPKRYDWAMTKYNFNRFMHRHFVFNARLGRIPEDSGLEQDQIEETEKFSAFVCGSDQIWKPGTFWFRSKQYLQFAPTSKRVAYAPSVGWKQIPDNFKQNVTQWKEWLSSVPYLSTRELTGTALVEEMTGRPTQTVVDPTMLLTPDEWLAHMKDPVYSDEISKILNSGKKYLLAYFLDHVERFRDKVRSLAEKLNLEIVWLTGRDNTGPIQVNCTDTDPAGFVNLINKAEFVCVDGFHGTCFSLNFGKPVAYFTVNKSLNDSNDTRVNDLFTRMGVDPVAHTVTPDTAVDHISSDFDFKRIRSLVSDARKISLKYLENALLGATQNKGPLYEANQEKMGLINDTYKKFIGGLKKTHAERDALFRNADFIKIRMLGTLLRDYGVRHVVLSPGGRDAPLVRMFENNQKSFTLHRITDERSAAYFGLGIAAQLGRPVACVCTSGTAVSNYLPAVTEAYFTGVPLIMITADRYEVYHNQGEDQTIPQHDVFRNVIKKSITVPEGSGYNVEYQTRRDISECILESVHNGFGPVHINIAIGDVFAGSKLPSQYWHILPGTIHPHIMRVTASDERAKLMKWVSSLSGSKRILVVYGQNARPTPKQLENIEKFVHKFNCVVLTDHLSNLNCSCSLQTFSMLRSITQKDFDSELTPDIVVSVGGKSLMNDPLTFKLRGGKTSIRHWSVNPSGQVRDMYFRLSSVLEMTQDHFFEFFSKNAGDIENDGKYFSKWKELNDRYSAPEIKGFTSNYVQSVFLPVIPKDSVLHLGVGLSFYDCRRYAIDESVDVFCNMGTNGIDGCTSTFLGQCSVVTGRKCFLLVGDLSFFYDLNSIWNKELNSSVRILLVNNNGSGLLRGHNLKGITSAHNTSARGWVESTGFEYISAATREEYNEKIRYFISDESKKPLFFEVFCD